MMKRLIYTLALLLGSLGVQAQTAQPNLPTGAERYSQTLWIAPDSSLWTGKGGNYTRVATNKDLRDLAAQGYTRAQVDSAITVNISFQNVKSFGAVGDGVTDDTEAIRDAMAYLKSSGDGRLFFPEGVYMISGTIYVPSDVEIFGDGKDKSIIRNLSDAELDLITPFGVLGNTQDENNAKFRTMWATETSDRTAIDSVRNVVIHDMGFDWNGLDAGNYSSAEMIIGRAVDCHIYNVHFFACLPADLDNTSTRRLGKNILFAFASDCSLSKSQINAADYESVSVWYLSKNVRIHDNIFDIDKPTTFVKQNHAIQLARPSVVADQLISEYGEDSPGPVYIYNNSFLLGEGINHAVTSHRGTGFYVTGNYIKSTGSAPWGIKPFDGTKDFVVSDNVIDFLANTTPVEGVTAISANSNSTTHEANDNGVISGNIVKIKQDLSTGKPAIGGDYDTTNNLIIESNIIEIHDYVNSANKGISVNGDNVIVSHNDIKYINPAESIDASGPVAVYSKPAANVSISGNISSGADIAIGVLAETGTTGQIYGNMTGNAFLNNFQSGMSVDWVNTTTTQTNIGGSKIWVGNHGFEGSNGIYVSPSSQAAPTYRQTSFHMDRVAGGVFLRLTQNGSTASAADLLGYSSSGNQLILALGGVSANGAYTNTSDSTIKNIVTDFDYSAVDSLKATPFTYKDNRDSGRVHVGYIAQEVREVLPDAVYESEETGLLSVDHVQVLIAKLAILEEKVKQLEARIEQLEN